jgi:hypothetical protein
MIFFANGQKATRGRFVFAQNVRRAGAAKTRFGCKKCALVTGSDRRGMGGEFVVDCFGI